MIDTENDGPETRSRKRRSSTGASALSDISNMGSNFIQQSINYVGKRLTKKRRTSGDDLQVNESTATTVANNPISSSSQEQTVAEDVQNDNNVDHIEEVLMRSDGDDQCTVGSSNAPTARDKELERYGFIHPAAPRRVALTVRGSDPCECLDVYDDIYGFLIQNESRFVTQNYFSLQTDMSPRIRAVLVDWIIEIHLKYRMHPLTLWMIINVFDRFLATTFMPRNRLQLAAIVSLFICCKFEEVHTPDVKDCLFLTDNTYTRADIVLTEAMILQAINYEMTVPTPYHFLIRIFRRIKASERLKSICNYIAERNLHECGILETSPRIYAAACVLAGLFTLFSNFEEPISSPRELWTDILREESGLTFNEILPCAKQLLIIMNIALQPSTRRKVESALRKYSTSSNHYVATLRYPTISESV